MTDTIPHQDVTVLAAQCASYQAGIATLRDFIIDQHFEVYDKAGRMLVCIALHDVLRLLKCIEADVADVADLAADAQEPPRQEVKQPLRTVSGALLLRLEALGFGDDAAEISGPDAVDAINEHFLALRQALA